jgi:cobalt-zinc-cadmium resistance protein CzcA
VGVGQELRTGSATFNGEESVVGTALMLIGANSRTVAAVDAKMADVRKTLPPHIEANTVLNRTKLVDATIRTVEKNLAEGAFLVIAVLFLLLGNIRTTFITARAIPLSMLMTATGMVQARVSGNLMSLGAIDFGLIVDGAVIIVENCLRRLAERQHALGRTLDLPERLHEVMAASKEMIQPTVCGQAIIITVYLPVLTLTGIEGKMFQPMALTVHAMRIPSTSLTQSTRMQFQVENTLKAFPEVALVFAKTGTAEMASDPMPPNVSDTFVMLKPRREWPDPEEPKSALLERMEEALRQLPGNNYEFTQPIQMRFNELIAGVRSDVAVKVYGDRFGDMQQTAAAIAGILQEIPGAADVKVEQTTGLPVLQIDVDRAAIGRYGLSVADVQEVAAIAVGGKETGLVFEGDRRFPLSVRLPEHLRQNLNTLTTLPVPLSHGEEHGSRSTRVAALGAAASTPNGPSFIPLGELARLEVREGPNQISRENGKRRVVVQANVRGRDLGSFVAEAEGRTAREVSLPSGGWLAWGGQFENLIAARERLSLVVPGCFLLIFLLLYSAFGSPKYALLVFTGVPLALTGGILSLWLRDIPFSISAAVGFIALSGVAVLNGLVMVTYINQLRKAGARLEEAIIQGSLTRLRPVLMTALVASLGFVPMALATGTGAEVQWPLATVVIGGLVTSTLLTLVVLPALYRLFERQDRAEPSSVQPR